MSPELRLAQGIADCAFTGVSWKENTDESNFYD